MADINVKNCLDWIRIAKAVKTVDGKPWASDRYERRFQCGTIDIRFSYRNAKSFMGRFGGGWNWKLGFQSGGSTLIVSLLVAELSFSRKKVKL